MSTIYYCIEKDAKNPISAGYLPEVWGNITGLAGVSEQAAADLTWAGYPNHGFMKREDALAFGVAQLALDAALETGAQIEGDNIRAYRNTLLSECDWTQLPDAPVNQQAWAAYRQALRDVTGQAGFPWDVQWPEIPA